MTHLTVVSRGKSLAADPAGSDTTTKQSRRSLLSHTSGGTAMRSSTPHKSHFTHRLTPACERQAALDSFYARCEGKNLSAGTISFYQFKLACFWRWLDDDGRVDLSLSDLTPRHLREFLSFERKRCSPQQARHVFVALRCFFKHLVADGFLSSNPLDGVDAPRTPKRMVPALSESEVKKLLEVCDDTFTGIRDRAIILLLLDTGCRAAELLAMTMEEMNLQTGMMKVIGKGNKEREVYFGDTALAALKDYLRRLVGLNPPTLFVNQYGDPLTYSGLAQLLRRRGKQAGLPAHACHPHVMRHTFATAFLRSGGDIFALKRLLGHESLAMVEQYLNLTRDDLAAAHAKHSPADSMRATQSASMRRRIK